MDSAKSIRFCGSRTWDRWDRKDDVGRLLFVLNAIQMTCKREWFVRECRESHKRTLSNLRSGRKLAVHPRRWPNPSGTPTLFDIPPGWFA